MNQPVAKIGEIRAFGPGDLHTAALTGIFKRLLPASQLNDKHWMEIHALVYREVYGTTMVAVAGEGVPLLMNDVIRTGPHCVLSIEFDLGGRVAVYKNTTGRIVSERSFQPAYGGVMSVLQRQVGIWVNISREKTTPLLIQTNGGVTGQKG